MFINGKIAATSDAHRCLAIQPTTNPSRLPVEGAILKSLLSAGGVKRRWKTLRQKLTCTSPIVTECTINMVFYVTLHRYLDEIPPSISFWPHYTLAWRYAKQGFLHGVNIPDPALWDTAPSKPSKHDFFTSDRLEDATFRTEEFRGTDSYMGQSSDDDDYYNSTESAHQIMINNPHVVGHFEKGNRPSDTCPHTCVILNQNVNCLGGKDAYDKLEKIIDMMIARNIHGYCL